jgi:hypothetical protein
MKLRKQQRSITEKTTEVKHLTAKKRGHSASHFLAENIGAKKRFEKMMLPSPAKQQCFFNQKSIAVETLRFTIAISSAQNTVTSALNHSPKRGGQVYHSFTCLLAAHYHDVAYMRQNKHNLP